MGWGRFFPHGPPASYEAARVYFLKATEALSEGRFEDGVRFLGVLLHYAQDRGSFPHVQPIHRNFHVRDLREIRARGYRPQLLGLTPEEAAEVLSQRVRELVAWTERRLAPLLKQVGLTMEEAVRLCAREIMPLKVVRAVRKVLSQHETDFREVALDCAGEMCQGLRRCPPQQKVEAGASSTAGGRQPGLQPLV